MVRVRIRVRVSMRVRIRVRRRGLVYLGQVEEGGNRVAVAALVAEPLAGLARAW
tara:strand:- start:248 stop:409 length:162 start_codon:yes stop_codon:yes gene_type:complete